MVNFQDPKTKMLMIGGVVVVIIIIIVVVMSRSKSKSKSAPHTDKAKTTKSVSMTPNGYQILPGGLIIQWGYISTFGSGVLYDFPIPFPNSVFSITATPYAGTISATAPISLSANNVLATANFTQKSFSFDADSSMQVYWMAIGH